MSAATDNRKYIGSGAQLSRGEVAIAWNGPVKANVHLYAGVLAGHLLADTAANPAIDNFVSGGTMRCLGFNTEECDNTGGALGARPMRVLAQSGQLIDKNAGGGSAIAITDLYCKIYGADNQTCSKLPADGDLIGILVGIDRDSGNPVVLVDPLFARNLELAQQSAYTKTYSTSSKTIPALTVDTLTDNTGGAAGTTLAVVTAPDLSAWDGAHDPTAAQATAIDAAITSLTNTVASLAAEIAKLKADALANKQNIVAIVKDLEAVGIAG